MQETDHGVTTDSTLPSDAGEVRPWEELARLAGEGDAAELHQFIDSLSSHEQSLAIDRLREDEQQSVLALLNPAQAADLVSHLPGVQALELIEDMPPVDAAAILHELSSDEQADLIGELDEADAAAILQQMDPAEAAAARRLSAYSDDEAGGWMITELLRYPTTHTVQQVIDDLAAHSDQYRDYDVQYAYLVDESDRLVGVLRMRDLLLSKRSAAVANLMISDPLSVTDKTSLDELFDVFESHSFFGVPVVDQQGILLGVVRRVAIETARTERQDATFRATQGIIGGEEIRSMPLIVRARRRLAWLSVNIVLNIIAASVIALNQDVLSSVIALAVFLPIISDMSGCSGNQAVAVSLRELSLGLVRENELLRVWIKEVLVGLLNGIALGLLVAAVAFLWKGNIYLGFVVGAALCLNTILAVSVGGLVPLILKRFKVDPAVAAGPILTTVTDMCGFFIVLTLASAMLGRLTGMQ